MTQNPYDNATSGGYAPGQVPGQRLVAMEEEPEEKMIEAALRPKSLDDFVGQKRVRQQLSLVLEASKMRGRSADHVLLSGPPGLGKTTLAMIIAAEMEVPLRITSGPAIQHSGDLAAILSSLTPGEVKSEGAPEKPDEPEKPKASPGDLLINEVMADPHGLTKLPATEYVELHNTTDHEIDLEGWAFVYDKTSIPLPDAELSAGGYAVLYKAGREISVADGAAEVAVKRFPVNMVNAGKPLALKDPSGTVIHSYTYPKAKAGRSIERGEGDKWHLSSDPRGGTPGEENSEGAPDKPDEPNKPNEPDATEQVEPREIVLNEILFDPQPRGSEYIELYNRSDRTLSTHGLAIALRKSDGHLGTRHSLTSLATTLAPGDYLVLTSDPNGVASPFRTPALDVIRRFKLPALNNQGATIVLLRTADSTVVDEVTYSAKWHSSAVKIRRGVALERISPDGSSQEAANWTSASSETGYGTPGYKNSQSGTSSQIEEGATISEPEYNASTRNYLIRYQMDKPDYRCQMAVYSSNGQKMAVIANNQLLTSEGEIRWDGAGLSPGVYVFYVELYHPDGSSQHIRKPLLVH